jgi:hypothetical protein
LRVVAKVVVTSAAPRAVFILIISVFEALPMAADVLRETTNPATLAADYSNLGPHINTSTSAFPFKEYKHPSMRHKLLALVFTD